MSSYKEQWFAEFEKGLNEAEDRLGRPVTDREYDEIGARTTPALNERLADVADRLRKESKGE